MTVVSSIYCLPSDILDEGPSCVIKNVIERAGVSGVTVAAAYHASSDVYPHNPLRVVATTDPGVFYRSDGAGYVDDGLQPTASITAAGRDVLEEACSAGGRFGVKVSAWVVFLHRDDLKLGSSAFQVNCFGDRLVGSICPANPRVRRYVLAMTKELCSYPISTLRAESLHYHGVLHGSHHERCLERLGEVTMLLLGLCFCMSCRSRAAREGLDVSRLVERCKR